MEQRNAVELREVTDPQERSAVCDRVLRSLPDWFGIEESIIDYVRDAAELPLFEAQLDGREAGFATMKAQTAHANEVHVMGVYAWAHRRGVGRALIERLAQASREQGRGYLTVKTLADSHPDEGYANTRRFYEAMGFRPIEVFPTLWDEANPCLLMIKRLD